MVFEKVCTEFESTLVGMEGEDNHVHRLVHYPPKHSVSTLVNSLKGVSSRMLRQERPGADIPALEGEVLRPRDNQNECGICGLAAITF